MTTEIPVMYGSEEVKLSSSSTEEEDGRGRQKRMCVNASLYLSSSDLNLVSHEIWGGASDNSFESFFFVLAWRVPRPTMEIANRSFDTSKICLINLYLSPPIRSYIRSTNTMGLQFSK